MDPERYIQSYRVTLPENHPHRAVRWMAQSWGDSPQMADELGGLIVSGTKTATCSAFWEYEFEEQALPRAGLLTVVLDGRGLPLCVIENVEVMVRRFCEVDAAFAWEEGEGDRSLGYWREEHRGFFTRNLASIGRVFNEDVPLVCERFRMVFP